MAKQLSQNYGDRAWTVCALAESTGEPWPVHGGRLSPGYPYVEAEVLYAARHEYACTAVDVLARRTRLAFVDAQAALAALPRVIEIMSKELGWSRARQRAEYASGVQFLGSMGLAPGTAVSDSAHAGWEGARSWRSWFESGFWRLVGLAGVSAPPGASSFKPSYSRTKFDAGEVDALRDLFDRRVASSSRVGRLSKAEIEPALKAFTHEWPGAGYEGFRDADYRYVFAQEGLDDRTDVDVDEFVEVGFLRFAPTVSLVLMVLLFRALDLRKLERRVHDARGQGGQEGAETDTCREERWWGVVAVGCMRLYASLLWSWCVFCLTIVAI